MACGFVLGILVIFLVQAERVCGSWAKDAQSFQNDNMHAGFLLDDEPRNIGNPQNQVRRVLVSPRLIQSSKFNTRSAAGGGSGQGLSTRGYLQALSSARSSVKNSVQSSARLVTSRLTSSLNRLRPSRLRADAQSEPRHLGRMGPLPARQGTPRSRSALSPSRNLYSFSTASGQSSAQKIPNYKQMGVSAFLSGPAAPRPRESHVQMRTYASAPAKKVSSSPRSLRQRGWRRIYKPSQGSEVYNLAVPRSSTVGGSAVVYDIPNHYGGFAIRRMKEPANNKVQQISPPPQWMAAYNPSLSRVNPESKWSRVTLRKL